MTQAVNRRSVTSMVRVRSQARPFKICGVQSGSETGFSSSTRFSPVNIDPPKFHTYLHLHVDLTSRTNGRSVGTFQKSSSFGCWGALDIEKCFILIFIAVLKSFNGTIVDTK
jgi:hypothetical protein